MKMRTTRTKLVAALATLILALTSSIVALQTTSASGLPTVRVLTPVFNPANETFA